MSALTEDIAGIILYS
nr:hypothetical protein [Tanacetum cinerariifolium]